jgi:hypothetical protein
MMRKIGVSRNDIRLSLLIHLIHLQEHEMGGNAYMRELRQTCFQARAVTRALAGDANENTMAVNEPLRAERLLIKS